MIYRIERTGPVAATAGVSEQRNAWTAQANRPEDPFFASLTPTVDGPNGGVVTERYDLTVSEETEHRRRFNHVLGAAMRRPKSSG